MPDARGAGRVGVVSMTRARARERLERRARGRRGAGRAGRGECFHSYDSSRANGVTDERARFRGRSDG